MAQIGIAGNREVCCRMDAAVAEPENVELDDCEEEIIDNEFIIVDEKEKTCNEKDLFKDFVENDKELVPSTLEEHNIETDLDLKDYSNKNVDLSENGSYLKLTLPNSKTIVVKKSSYCWLLDEGNARVSTDRLKRFIISSKRQPSKIMKPKTKKGKFSGKRSIRKVVKKKKDEYADSSTDLNSDSDSDSDKVKECVTYDDSTDTETFDSDADKTPTEEESKVELIVDKYYAVQYNQKCYLYWKNHAKTQ